MQPDKVATAQYGTEEVEKLAQDAALDAYLAASAEVAWMNQAITEIDRYRVLAGYHHDIFFALEQRQLQRAMRFLFGFAEDYCANFEHEVADLSEEYLDVIDPQGDQKIDPSLFLQSFYRLWIAMEDQVLSEFSSAAIRVWMRSPPMLLLRNRLRARPTAH